MGTVEKTLEISTHPTSYDTTHYSYASISSSYPISNAYTDSSSTTYAQVNWKTGSSAETYVYLRFDFSAIPSDATINSVSASVKGYVNTTSSQRVTTRQMQLVAGTTLKGSALTMSTSTSAQYFTNAGTWTRSELQNVGIRFYVKRGTSNTSSSYQIRIYGATITVNYTYLEQTWTVTVSGNGATPSGDTDVANGDSLKVKIYGYDKSPIVTDNGVDVSNQLVQDQDKPASYTVEQADGTNYGFELNSDGYYESNNQGRSSSTALSIVRFSLPVSATITFSVINYAESTYDFGILGNIDEALSASPSEDLLYHWSGKNNNSSYVQTITYQMPSGEHYIYVKYFKDNYTNSGNDSFQFKVSIELSESVSYETYWAYTVENVTEDHIIAVFSNVIYIKENSTWVPYTIAWKKINGVWVKQDDLLVFDSETKYVRG